MSAQDNKNRLIEIGRGTQFSATNQPITCGRTKGVRNKSTIIKEILDTEIEGCDIHGANGSYTVEELMTIAIAKKAIKGDVAAYKEILEGRYGKNPIIGDNSPNNLHIDYSLLSDVELQEMNNLLLKAMGYDADGSLSKRNGIEDAEEIK